MGGPAGVLRTVMRSVEPKSASTDRELLFRFARDNDQSAFEALVKRHTPMVLGVCRRALPTVQDAEHACQATFLVLAKRAASDRWHESVANWLYTTARKVAHNARLAADRRARRESQAAIPEAVAPVDRMTGRELLTALDRALDALPARYREPLVLCYLEGLTRDEAATRLGVPRTTLHTHIDRARKRLHAILSRAGCAPGIGLLALAVTPPASAAPPRLVDSILTAVSGRPPTGVGELTGGVNGPDTLLRLKWAVAGAFGLLAVGFALAVSAAGPPKTVSDQPDKSVMPAPEAGPKNEPTEPKKEKRIEIKGVVLGPDDKPVPGAKLSLSAWKKLVPAPQKEAAADGTFAFTLAVDEREYPPTLIATANGHGIAWSYLGAGPLTGLTLRLPPDEPIRGKVIDLEGKPVAGVSVSVVRMCGPRTDKTLDRWLKVSQDPKADASEQFQLLEPGADPWGLIPAVTSDRDGRFEIRGVGRDRLVILRVTGPTRETHELTVVTRRVERFTSERLLVGWGPAVHGSEPVAVAAPVPVTKGRVLDAATGKPIPGAAVHAVPWEPAVADAEGRFTLPGLPPRKNVFSVLVVPPTGSPYHWIIRTVPDDATARAAFDLKLTRGIPATVKIVDKTTRQPVDAALRYGVFAADNPNVKVVPDVWHHGEWVDSPNAPVARKSEYRITVFPGPGLLAAGVRWSERDYLSGVGVEAFDKHNDGNQISGLCTANMVPSAWNTFARIDVPADAKEFSFTLELDRGLEAAGRLADGTGAPLVGVTGHGLRKGLPGQGGWVSVADAAFTVTALRAGEKRRVMFVHPERKLAGVAIAVGGAKEPLEVRLEPWGEATRRLVGVTGEPVRGRVDLSADINWSTDIKRGSSPFSNPEIIGPETDAQGRFRIIGLVPGQTYRWNAVGYNKLPTVKVPDTVAKSGKTIDLGDIVLSEEP